MNNKRIVEIANLIQNKDLVVDVGSDHAQLSILLISQKKCNKVINIEKNQKPYLTSVNNTKHLNDKISNILSDGFQKFDPKIEIDVLTISGMGAKNMVDIINKSSNNIKNIILCPNNNENLLREYAYRNSYKIKKDFTVEENNFLYPIIWLSKVEGYKVKNNKKLFFLGNRKLKKEDSKYKELLTHKINCLSNIKDIKIKNKEKYKELKWYQKELKKLR